MSMQIQPSSSQRIIEAAQILFASNGFHQTSMQELAKFADISVGAIYRLYESKSDVILAIIDQNSRRILEELRHDLITALGREDSLLSFIESYIQRMLSTPGNRLTYEILAEAQRNPAVTPAIEELNLEYRMALTDFFHTARPSASKLQRECAGELFLAWIFGFAFQALWHKSGNKVGIARTAAEMISSVLI